MRGDQPSSSRAFVGSPRRVSTSAGLKYSGSTATTIFPLSSRAFSWMPSPSQESFISSISAANVWITLIGFVAFYSALAVVDVFLIVKTIKAGPPADAPILQPDLHLAVAAE